MCERASDASSTELILIGSDVLKPVSTSTCCFISLADAAKEERSSPEKGKNSFCRSPYQIGHLVDIKIQGRSSLENTFLILQSEVIA